MKEENKASQEPKQTIIINQQTSGSNSVGIAGFVFAILSWPLSCFPILGTLVWLLGVILSIIGLFKKPRGLAIAGVIISFIGLILIILFFVGVLGLAALSEIGAQ